MTKKATYLKVISKPINYAFSKYFTNNRKKTNRPVVLSYGSLSNILKYRNLRWDLPTLLEIKILQTHIDKFSWFFMKVQTPGNLEPPEIQSESDAFEKFKVSYKLWNIKWVTNVSHKEVEQILLSKEIHLKEQSYTNHGLGSSLES